jgi:hypothetical protein
MNATMATMMEQLYDLAHYFGGSKSIQVNETSSLDGGALVDC